MLLSVLQYESAIDNNPNFNYIDLKIILIITSDQVGANVYYWNKKNENQNTMKFSHLVLYKVHSTINKYDNYLCIYIMEACNKNTNLCNKNSNHSENGAISIGLIVHLQFPFTIEP